MADEARQRFVETLEADRHVPASFREQLAQLLWEEGKFPSGCVVVALAAILMWVLIFLVWAVATGKFDRRPGDPACVGTLDPTVNRQCERPLNP